MLPAMAAGTVAGSEGPPSERPDAAFPLCFHRGRFLPWEEVTLHVNSLALRYALSVFEGIRLYLQAGGPRRPLPFRLAAHLERLRSSLRLMRLPEPPELDRLPAILDELVERNEVAEDAYLRVAVSPDNFGTIGSAPRPTMTATLVRMGRKRWLAEGRGMRVAISGWQRCSEASFPARAKNISNYAGPRLALLEARAAGYDGAVLTDDRGHLCEAPTAALFIVKEGEALTPPLSDGVLPSITRATVLELCRALGLPADSRRLCRADAYTAEEAFLCGTGIELAPIGEFDGHPLPGGAPGEITSRLVDAYFRLVRGDAVEADDGP